MLKEEKQKFYLILSAFLILGVILIWQGIIKSQSAISASIQEIRDKNMAIVAYGIRENTLARDMENYNFVKGKLNEINEYFVDGGENSSLERQNLPDFIKNIEDIADGTSNSLAIDFLNKQDSLPGDSAPEKKSSDKKNQAAKTNDSYILRLNLGGGFKELANFIAQFESMPYYVYIDSIIINAEASSARSGNAGEKYFSGNIKSTLVVRAFGKKNFNPQ